GENTGSRPVRADLRLILAPGRAVRGFVAPDAAEPATAPQWATETSEGLAHGWTSLPVHGSVAVCRWQLAAKERAEETIVIPSHPTAAQELARWAREGHARRAELARRYWTSEMDRGTQVELGDPEVENAVRAALVLLLTCREQHDNVW